MEPPAERRRPVPDRVASAVATLARLTVLVVTRAIDLCGRMVPEEIRVRLRERDLPWVVLGVVVGIGITLTVGATAASALVYDAVEDGEGLARVDRPVLDWVLTQRTRGRDEAVTWFTDLGSVRLMVPMTIVLAALLWWWWRRPTPAILMMVAGAGSVLMTVVGKHLVGRPRPALELAVPPYETSPAFPSGHALNSWVLWILVGYLVATRLPGRWPHVVVTTIAATLAVLMGLSRVYLGHHWLSDVLVGWTLGTAWLAVIITGHRVALAVRRSGRAGSAPATADAEL